MGSCRAALFGTFTLLLLVTPAFPAESLPREEVDRFVRPLVEGEYCQSLVVGLVDSGGTRVLGYGKKSSGKSAAPDGETVFEIGSATKVFTGLVLADMVRRGEVSLDDPLQKF